MTHRVFFWLRGLHSYQKVNSGNKSELFYLFLSILGCLFSPSLNFLVLRSAALMFFFRPSILSSIIYTVSWETYLFCSLGNKLLGEVLGPLLVMTQSLLVVLSVPLVLDHLLAVECNSAHFEDERVLHHDVDQLDLFFLVVDLAAHLVEEQSQHVDPIFGGIILLSLVLSQSSCDSIIQVEVS